MVVIIQPNNLNLQGCPAADKLLTVVGVFG
jgi:hypothetical protein